MIPETFPVLTADDMLPSPSLNYEDGDQRSVVGWLKHLYLIGTGIFIVLTPQDMKEYHTVCDKLRKINSIPKRTTLEDWEDTKSPAQQAAALNKLRRALGYTEIFEV